jgi:iron complex transport system permease protein
VSKSPAPRPVRALRGPRRLSIRFEPRAALVCVLLAAVALTLGLLLIGTGDIRLSPAEVLRTLDGRGTAAQWFVVHELRLPRVLVALLVGVALGVAGSVFQSVSRNPLGSPDIIGFTHGSVAGALTVIVLFGGSPSTVAAGAVAGGLCTGLVVYLLSWRGGVHGYRLILVGIGAAATLTAVNGYLLTRADYEDAARSVLWLTGSLQGRGWTEFWPLLAACALLIPAALGQARPLRLLEMGDDAARALGGHPERTRLFSLLTAVLLTSAATAAAGPIAFVALAAPQLARRLTRAAGPNLPAAALMGAALLVTADWLAQHAIDATVLPVGAVTGILGGCYLLWLLYTERRAGRI